MTAGPTALIAAIARAHLASCGQWTALAARTFEHMCAGMQMAFDACAEGHRAVACTATAWGAAPIRSARTRMAAEPWLDGAAWVGHPAMTCLVAEYADDMGPRTFAAGRR